MAAADILTRFEVNLNDSVVQDILTPGKTFESEIWKGDEKEYNAGSSVLLQKLGDSIFKLLVTVYKPLVNDEKPETSDGAIQTEGKKTDVVITQTDQAETEHSSMQTKNAELESSAMQTDKQQTGVQPTQTDTTVNIEESSVQTDSTNATALCTQTETTVNIEESSVQTDATNATALCTQTDKAKIEETAMQTEAKKTGALPTQTESKDHSVQLTQTEQLSGVHQVSQTETKSLNESFMQTEEKQYVDSCMQTDNNTTVSTDMQTENNPTVSVDMQTENNPTVETDMQTENNPTADSDMQTENNSTVDSDMQTENNPTVETNMQTENNPTVNSEMQTYSSFFNMCEQQCQTFVDMVEGVSQTELEQADSECQTVKDEQSRDTQTIIKEYVATDIQTDSSMAYMTDQDCQAVVDQFDGECQAVTEMAEGEVQATVTQAEGECQASVEQKEGECQAVVQLIEGYSQVELEVAESFCQAVVDQSEADCQVQPDALEMQAQTDASFFLLEDGESQTDATEATVDNRSVCLQTEAVKIKTKIVQTEWEEEKEQEATQPVPAAEAQAPDNALPQEPINAPVAPSQIQQAEAIPQTSAELAIPQVITDVPVLDPNIPAGHEPQVVQLQEQPQMHQDPAMISIINEPEFPGQQQQPGVLHVGLDGIPIGADGDMPSIVSIAPLSKEEQATIISIEPVKKEERHEKADCKEMSCQTEPVTIIIGDASFLVNRLKYSSSQPAKVKKNEIEIEVGPESDKKDLFSSDPYQDFDGRSGRVQRVKTEPRRQIRSNKSPRIKKEKIQVPRELPAPPEPEPVQRLPPPGSDTLGQFSCPFCALTFHESPALYEHLQVDHDNITGANTAKSKATRPPGGKARTNTRARKRAPNPPPELEPNHDLEVNDMIEAVDGVEEQGPPILTPYREGEEYTEEAELAAQEEEERRQQQHDAEVVYDDRPPGEEDGPGLFEDVPEPKLARRGRKPRGLHERNKGVFPPMRRSDNSNFEFDCPMCPEKFGSPDILYVHIRRNHKDEDNSRKRVDVVNALMHDKLASPETPPVCGRKRRRRLPMVATDSSADTPAKRRRTKEVIEEFEDSLVEDMTPGGPQAMVERVEPEELEEEERAAYVENSMDNLVERINPEDDEDPEEEDHLEGDHLEGEEAEVPSDMLDNMVEVVVQEPEDHHQNQLEEEDEVGMEEISQPVSEEQAEDEAAGLIEAIGEEEEEEEMAAAPVEEEEIQGKTEKDLEEMPHTLEEEDEELGEKPSVGLRRTRHSLKGQGPPRSTPRTRGGRRN